MTITEMLGRAADIRADLPAESDRGGSTATIHSGTEIPGLIGLYPYSGADIKLVVHMPPEPEGSVDGQLGELREELETLQAELERTPSEGAIDQLGIILESSREELEEAQTLLLITPEGTPERTALEERIAELNTQIAETTAAVNAAVSSRRPELEESIATTARAIEALREDEGDIPPAVTKVLAEVQTLSISTHREKYPVRTLGSVYPRSFTRGPRTISGSMVFTTFHRHIFDEFFGSASFRSSGVGDFDRHLWTSFITDQLPPLDISVVFANEYGNLSWMAILGVEFVNEGMTMSIEDLFLEGTAQYVARDYDPIRSVDNRPYTRTHGVGQSVSGTSLTRASQIRRMNGRNNPFL